MIEYNKNKHNLEPLRAGALGRSALRLAPKVRTPYLTRTNKSTTTSVNFDVFLCRFDYFSESLSKFIKSTKKWLSHEVAYE